MNAKALLCSKDKLISMCIMKTYRVFDDFIVNPMGFIFQMNEWYILTHNVARL